MTARGAIYVTDTTAVTGSFSSVQVAGTIAEASVGGEAEFANIQFGLHDGYGANTSPSSSGTCVVSVELSGSAVIPGPVFGFKLVNGSALAYYMDEKQ
tara:strand:- start:129 stop:422 length:294 start_codon:yes stop_codon:yes gene_type:complete